MTPQHLTPSVVLAAAGDGLEAVRALCAGLTDDALRAEIERFNWHATGTGVSGTPWSQARAALETEIARRAQENQ